MVNVEWQTLNLDDDHDDHFEGDPGQLIDAAAFVATIARRPTWHQRAACRGRGLARWFPTKGQPLDPARRHLLHLHRLGRVRGRRRRCGLARRRRVGRAQPRGAPGPPPLRLTSSKRHPWVTTTASAYPDHPRLGGMPAPRC